MNNAQLPADAAIRRPARLPFVPAVLGCLASLLAGCAASGPSTSAASLSKAAVSPSTPASSDNTAGATSTGGGSQPGLGWKTTIGRGVSIVPPSPKAAGHGSPGAATQGLADGLNSGKLSHACPYFEPSFQSQCQQRASPSNATNGAVYKNFALGYVVTDGARALVGSTGIFCQPGATPECVSNTDPAAIFDTGKTFPVLWSETFSTAQSSTNAYSLVPCVRIGRRWYVAAPASG
ncbi:MAG: hypothetical protein ACLQFR_27245 [Streptosporangiaceae bacterium]